MSRWFRFYSDAMRTPKVASLPDNDFRLWVELLAVAAENSGSIPPEESLKHLLRRRLDHLKGGVKRLIRAGLIDVLDDGYEPHNWNKFQYKSDTSTERVHKHRKKRNVSVTPPDTETDTETDIKIPKVPLKRNIVVSIPDGVSDKTWRDFGIMRQKKGAPITETAMTAIQREADKAGWRLEDALVESISRGWRGFKADWVKIKDDAEFTGPC